EIIGIVNCKPITIKTRHTHLCREPEVSCLVHINTHHAVLRQAVFRTEMTHPVFFHLGIGIGWLNHQHHQEEKQQFGHHYKYTSVQGLNLSFAVITIYSSMYRPKE